MSLALTMALVACKGGSQKESKDDTKEGSQKGEEPQETPAWQKAPQIGDQCQPMFDLPHCDGKDLVFCKNQFADDEDINISAIWTKDACENGFECRHIENGRDSEDTCVESAKLFPSCEAALADFWAKYNTDMDPGFCYENENIWPGEGLLYTSKAPLCLDVGDGKKIITRSEELCSICKVNEHTVICEQSDVLLGKNAKEGDYCLNESFVPSYVGNNSALVCPYSDSEDYSKVKKVTCPAGREIALFNNDTAVCIDPQEAECASHVSKCASVPAGTASIIDKICLETDKGKHLLVKEDILDNFMEKSLAELPIMCGTKGCNEATGACLDAAPSNFKWCKDGQFGFDCKPCTCDHGQCVDGFLGNGECSSCDEGYFSINCDKTYSGTMTDNKNRKYNTILINNVEWMAENLATDTATDGTPVTCYANTQEDADFIKNYGCLYTWADALKVCPKGWHLPTQTEFNNLLTYIGEGVQDLRARSWDGTDKYGFSALPAGSYYDLGYEDFGSDAYFWSSKSGEGGFSENAYHLFVSNNTRAGTRIITKERANSVRCIKD